MRYRTRVWYYEEDGSRHQGKGHIKADAPVDVEFNDFVVNLIPSPNGTLTVEVQPNKMRTGKWLGLPTYPNSRLQGVSMEVCLVDEEGRPSSSIRSDGPQDGEGSALGPGHSRRK